MRIIWVYLLTICMGLISCKQQNMVDYVLYNATIYTVNEKQPTAEAMAIARDGRILAVGSTSELLNAYPGAHTINMQGHTIIPGLIDAHAHLMGLGVSMMRVNLVGTRSVEEVIERLKRAEAQLPEGAWLLGRGWDQNDWPDKVFPTHQMLDKAFPDRPVWIRRIDGHAAWANMAAMRPLWDSLLTASDPEGGKIIRDAQGRPTGVFVDAAMRFIDEQVPEMSEKEAEQALQLAIQTCNRYGLTGVHDAGVSQADIERYRRAIDAGTFSLRVYAMIGGMGETFNTYCQSGPLIHDRLQVQSVKFYIDGALGSRGAALLQPYADDPDNRGLLQHTPEEFTAMVKQAMECGFQVNTHAIGDRGNRVVLDAYEQAMQAVKQHPGRHRVEHAQVVALEDIPRFRMLDVIASMQPTHATSDMYWAEDRLGQERLKGAYAWRRFLDAGVRLAFGSDFPVEHPNPMLGIYAAVTRQDTTGWPPGGWLPDQRLTRAEALKAFTLDAAYAAFQEHEVGSLEPGKHADFVVLDRDIMQIPAADIFKTRVVATYLDGKKVYEWTSEGD